ncbi:MAG: copper transporter [Actinomycetota bacterium]
MIDFRYLVVTVISIFLALMVGIMLGAGFVGDPLARNLRDRIDTVNKEVRDQREQIDQLRVQNEDLAGWAQAVGPWAIENRLNGRSVVMFTLDGADGGVVDGSLNALERSGATVTTQINLGPKLALESPPEADQLATIVESVAKDSEEVVLDAATALGESAASLARDGEGPTDTGEGSTQVEYSELLRLLEEEDFMTVARNSEEGEIVPQGASFVVAGGNATPEPFDVSAFVTRLTTELAVGETDVVVTESSSSQWDMVSTIRTDDEANALVSTVDVGEGPMGHVALVLALDEPSSEPPGQFGTDEGARLLPDPPDD